MIIKEVSAVHRKSLSANGLKLIAIGMMTIDHLVWTVAPGYDRTWWILVCHGLGRITAPVMWFFIAEGFHYTRSVKRYALRLFLLAVVSHFTYAFCFGNDPIPLRSGLFNQTGEICPLGRGFAMLVIYTKADYSGWMKLLLTFGICVLTFPADWSSVAAMAVLFMGMERGNFKRQMLWMLLWSAVYGAVYAIFLDWVYGLLQLATCLSVPLLACYDGTRGRNKWTGKLFYIYYPAHLMAFGLMRCLLS